MANMMIKVVKSRFMVENNWLKLQKYKKKQIRQIISADFPWCFVIVET